MLLSKVAQTYPFGGVGHEFTANGRHILSLLKKKMLAAGHVSLCQVLSSFILQYFF
jgi:hypothetical protein